MGQEPHPNIARYRRVIQAFNTNDLATVMELVHPDMVYRVAGRSPIA